MKVVPQLITFIVLVVAGWFAYENHRAFQDLTDDVIEYADLNPATEQKKKVAKLEKVSAEEKQQVPQQMSKEPENIAPVPKEVAAESVAVEERTSAALLLEGEPTPASDDKPTVVTEAATVALPTSVQTQAIKPEPIEKISTQEQAVIVANLPAVTTEPSSATVPTPGQIEAIKATPQVQYPLASPKQPVADAVAPAPVLQQDAEISPQPLAEPETPMPVEESVVSEPEASSQQRKNKALTGLSDARRAWLEGNQDAAIAQYQSLMQEFSNHPDYAGELGNIYFSRGELDLAVSAYSEAVVRLLKNGDVQRARQAHTIVLNLDQEQGGLLREYFAPLR